MNASQPTWGALAHTSEPGWGADPIERLRLACTSDKDSSGSKYVIHLLPW
jgi:hypothetical protein